jgi:hypothetical protein
MKSIYFLKFYVVYFGVIIIAWGCNNEKPGLSYQDIPKDNLVADTIVYDVLISNPNPEDTWTEKCLDNLNKTLFVEQIFQGIYSGELQPYDYYEDKPMRLSKIKRMEKNQELQRNHIGKVQFTERWYYDPVNLKMKKEVISMVLGEQLLNSEGEVRGYKPIFKVHLK